MLSYTTIQEHHIHHNPSYCDFSNTIGIGAIYESSYSLNIVFYLFGNYIIYQYPNYYACSYNRYYYF
jgi:hypothetical protein